MTEQPDLAHTVERIVSHTQQNFTGDAVSLLLVRDGAFEVTTATDVLVEKADALQFELGEGPTWSPDACQDTVLVDDLSTESTWPLWSSGAARLGWLSLLSIRLFTPVRTLGAINVYSHDVAAFTAEEAELSMIFGRHASIALMGAQSSDSLRAAVTSRHVIGQAQGILMERYHVDADRAFVVLRRYSQDRNIKLRVIAEQVIATHRLPE
ncbi:MAG: ANTAR domain-containing protein [Propionibacteriaceae bacterium]